ncbi:glycoside hydrolase family 9 protein [Peristeroidobacter agariperforans]|uniref:glycoside hydrolase family 9 protein n=1 Tax=Peristeroidobacter agariperforans TaxID=268404 RepID=UPI00101BFC54|nr:glycoside hydrolase family 9 protein [Peristeroidobacter agariperforans]
MSFHSKTVAVLCAAFIGAMAQAAGPEKLVLTEKEYFAAPGLDVLVFNNTYDGLFSDAKIAGIELIHHGVRTATNGDVRLGPTPEQWDPTPAVKKRTVDKASGAIDVHLHYPQHKFEYVVHAEPSAAGVRISVALDRPLPRELEGKAGFNLEFLPSAYFTRTYLMDRNSGALPLYPFGPSGRDAKGETTRLPMATGHNLTLAPEDAERRVTITSNKAELALYDGRNQAQNGWFVVRSLLPAGKTGTVLEWTLSASTIPGWTRPAVIGHSQVGYGPSQQKIAVIEADPRAAAPSTAKLLKVNADGTMSEAFSAPPRPWGDYLRYRYYTFDFSTVQEPGLYMIEAGGQRTHAFRIAHDVLASAWQPTLDVYFPVAMDHMFVNEAYRVWHGASHLDDARQAAENKEHFDLYGGSPSNDSPFKAGEHIPGLNVGGWYDAGDFDLRTQTHYSVVQSLVDTWERYKPMRDETSINQERRHVEIHRPDGVPDLLQQIEHGTLFLISQYRVFGHAIPGIVEPDLGQYTHLGDAVTKTDNKIDDPTDPNSAKDDRLAFTTATTALNYGSAAALAAASRALRGYRDALADECLSWAQKAWDFEGGRKPNLFAFGNTTGGNPEDEELRAAVELLLATKDAKYAARVNALWPAIDQRFMANAADAVRVMPLMGKDFAAKLRARAAKYRDQSTAELKENPYGVPVTRAGWAGNGTVVAYSTAAFFLHTAFPDLFDREAVFRGLNFLYGTHPSSDISFVSGVGTHSKKVAYGNNRADFSFIAGGIVPGVLILKPDFPENKEDWPYLWGENEYVINVGASYIFLVHAAQELLNRE